MRHSFLAVSIMATTLLTACAEDGTAPRPVVGEDQIRCYAFEQTFTNPEASVSERSRARSNFFANDCVLRGGSFSPPRG
jgi:hypothetical protein